MTGEQSSSVGYSGRSWLRHVKYEHLVAGISGGVTATVALHPLDLIKVRFQVRDGATTDPHTSYDGIRHAFRSIIKESGWSGLYQGVVPNIWGAGMAWGLYFFGYNVIKDWIKEDRKGHILTAQEHLFAASVTGVGTLTITNPIWVSKTRLCVQNESTNLAAKASGMKYNGMIDTLYKTWRNEGFRGLYKGYLPGLFGVSHGALQFMSYEELKKLRSAYFGTPITHKLSAIEYVMMAALSKIFASCSTYPYQVVRSRLQDQYNIGRYDGAVDVIRKTWRVEGIYGFYKGLLPNILKVTPACCVTFVVYENILSFLQRHERTM